MTDIFISYSRTDRARVEPLAAALEASGFTVWWDRKLAGGIEFTKETESQLNEAAAVLVCWSNAAVESMWVADEATVGREKKILVPISLDAAPPKLGFRQLQTINFADWTGDAAAPEFQELAQALRAKIGGMGASPPIPSYSAGASVGALTRGVASTPKLLIAVGLVAAFAAVAFGLSMRRADPPVSEKSVAVLPFDDRPGDGAASGDGDWLAEIISSLLGKAGDLRVISQSSASAFKGETAPVSEIARKLGVALIVEGSVLRRGEDIVISAQLIDAASDQQVWAEIYERKSGNALGFQSEVAGRVAAAVADAMKVTIAENETQALAPTAQPRAFEAYQRALQLYRTTIDENVRRAQGLIGEAIKLDPDFALAWALLSRIHSYLYFNSSDATEGRRAAAEATLVEALRLKPDLAEVMLADAYFQYWVNRDFEGARTRFEALRERWPNNTDVLTALASIARRQGRWDDSKVYFESAVAIDPLRPGRRLSAAEANLATRDFDGALRQLDASLAHWPEPPDNAPFIAKKALVLQVQGRLDDAAAVLVGFDPPTDGVLVQPIVYQALLTRRPADAIAQIEDLLRRDEASGSVGRTSVDLNLYLGDLRRLAADVAAADENYGKARDELLLELAKQPGSADIHSYLALAYAGLGEGAAAGRHAALAVEAVPVEKDALSGAYYLDVEARVAARAGDHDAAIPAIEALMTMPAILPLTPALLRLDPDFDKLREDARFAALMNDGRGD